MSKTFSAAYGEVAGNRQQLVKEEIKSLCNWGSDQLFSMKKNGTRALTPREESAVEYVFLKEGIKPWPQETPSGQVIAQ